MDTYLSNDTSAPTNSSFVGFRLVLSCLTGTRSFCCPSPVAWELTETFRRRRRRRRCLCGDLSWSSLSRCSVPRVEIPKEPRLHYRRIRLPELYSCCILKMFFCDSCICFQLSCYILQCAYFGSFQFPWVDLKIIQVQPSFLDKKWDMCAVST